MILKFNCCDLQQRNHPFLTAGMVRKIAIHIAIAGIMSAITGPGFALGAFVFRKIQRL